MALYDYTEYNAARGIKPATATAQKSFLLGQAWSHEEIAKEWAEKGNELQAERWNESAAKLRERAGALQ